MICFTDFFSFLAATYVTALQLRAHRGSTVLVLGSRLSFSTSSPYTPCSWGNSHCMSPMQHGTLDRRDNHKPLRRFSNFCSGDVPTPIQDPPAKPKDLHMSDDPQAKVLGAYLHLQRCSHLHAREQRIGHGAWSTVVMKGLFPSRS